MHLLTPQYDRHWVLAYIYISVIQVIDIQSQESASDNKHKSYFRSTVNTECEQPGWGGLMYSTAAPPWGLVGVVCLLIIISGTLILTIIHTWQRLQVHLGTFHVVARCTQWNSSAHLLDKQHTLCHFHLIPFTWWGIFPPYDYGCLFTS